MKRERDRLFRSRNEENEIGYSEVEMKREREIGYSEVDMKREKERCT